jgi:nucleoid DNA-binding protein
MTRKELVERVREGLSPELSERQVAEVIERALAEIGAAIQRDGRVTLPGFGTFTVRVAAARLGRNPRSGEVIDLPAASTVGFKPAAELRAGLPLPGEGGAEPPPPPHER